MIAVTAAGLTAVGRTREENEDSFVVVCPDDPLARERKGHLLAVADGLGGHAAGQVASAAAIAGLVEAYYAPTSPGRVEAALQRAIQTANLRIHEQVRRDSSLRGMQTTLSCLVLAGSAGYLGHVGDSRIYRCRDGELRQLTGDHSEAAELVRLRLARPESLAEHPRRNVLTRTLGSQLFPRPDFQRVPVQPGDAFVLCTDGLWSEVTDEEIAAIVAEEECESACRRLVDLQVGRFSLDNVTVAVVKVLAVDTEPAQNDSWLSGFVRGLVQPRGTAPP
jgi:protein phosphatase